MVVMLKTGTATTTVIRIATGIVTVTTTALPSCGRRLRRPATTKGSSKAAKIARRADARTTTTRAPIETPQKTTAHVSATGNCTNVTTVRDMRTVITTASTATRTASHERAPPNSELAGW